jgi:hypothetical protein
LTPEVEEEEACEVGEKVKNDAETDNDVAVEKPAEESPEAKEEEADEDEDKKEEEDQTKKSVINGHASPFYPSGYLSPSPPIFVSQHQSSRPNLFLYSPTSNTMIPCEEIVIPNPVVGPEGSAVYPGPSNIYLVRQMLLHFFFFRL